MKSKTKLQKNVVLYNMSKFVNTTGNLTFPLLTYLLLKTLLIQESYIGVFIMIISMMKIPGYLLGGIVGDRFNYKRIAALFPIVCGSLMIACNFLIDKKYIVIILLCLSKFFSGVASPSSVKIMDALTNENNKKEIFAQTYMTTNIGMAIAAICSGYLFNISAYLVFTIDGITRILSGLIVFFIKFELPEKYEKKIHKKHNRKGVWRYMTQKRLQEYIFVTSLFMYIYSQYSYAIPLELDNIFVTNSESVYSIVLLTNCITVIVATPIMKKFSKKVEPLKCIQISFGLLLVGFCMYYIELNVVEIVLSTILWSLGEVLFGINELVYIAEKVEKDYFARTVSIYDSMQNIISSLAPMINGFLILRLSLKTSWLSLGFLCIIGVLYIFIIRRNNTKERS